jgi:hypothetical protein
LKCAVSVADPVYETFTIVIVVSVLFNRIYVDITVICFVALSAHQLHFSVHTSIVVTIGFNPLSLFTAFEISHSAERAVISGS